MRSIYATQNCIPCPNIPFSQSPDIQGAVCTYLLKKRGLNNTVKSEHKVGNLYVGNFNIHQCFRSPAFKDHDYNVIYDTRNGQRFVIAPTVYATLGIKSVTEP
jgi:hypothetical protein